MYAINHTSICFRSYTWELTESSTLTEKLKTLGLTENECKVYFALLKLGAGTALQLSRETHL